MSFFYTSPSKACIDAWKKRENVMSKNTSANSADWQWSRKRTPWAMVTSLQAVVGDEMSRLRNILYSGLSTNVITSKTKYSTLSNENLQLKNEFSDIYGKYSRPMPGLKEVSIEQKGTMGALREATVKFVVWTDEQLEEFELLYLVPSAGVRIEWGWSHTPDGEPVIPYGTYPLSDLQFDAVVRGTSNITTDQKNIIDPNNNILNKINIGLRAYYGGHYDAMQGVVSNFSWTKNESGGYDCEFKIFSRGESLLSTQVNSTRKRIKLNSAIEGIAYDSPKSEEKETDVVIYDMLGIWQVLWKADVSKTGGDLYVPLEIPATDASGLPSVFQWGNQWFDGCGCSIITKGEVQSNMAGDGGDFNTQLKYVTLNTILRYFLNANVADIVDDKSFGYPSLFGKDSLSAKFEDDRPILARWTPNMVSANPLMCVIPGALARFNNEAKKSGAPDESIDWLNMYEIGPNENYSKGGDMPNLYQKFSDICFKDTDTSGKIDIRAILINLEYLRILIMESSTVDDFLSKLLSQISSNVGNIWDFSVLIEDGLARIVENNTIIDPQAIAMPVNLSTSKIDGKIVGSCIRSFSMASDLGSAEATMAVYGGACGDHDNPSDTDYGNNEKGDDITVGWRLYGGRSRNLALGGSDGVTRKIEANENIDGKTVSAVNPYRSYVDAVRAVYHYVSADSIENARKNLTDYIQYKERQLNHKTDNGGLGNPAWRPMLNISLSFDCDGFGLFRMGNMIKPTFLPKRFEKFIEYMVFKTSHVISNTDFVTTVECKLRPKFLYEEELIKNASPTQKDSYGSDKGSARLPAGRPYRMELNNGEIIENGRVPVSYLSVVNNSSLKKILWLKDAIDDLNNLNNAFYAKFGKYIPFNDGYRDYAGQERAYQTMAKGYAAVPGRSRHGFGIAFDFNTHDDDKKSGYLSKYWKWFNDNVNNYGFEVFAPSHTPPEAWHIQLRGTNPTRYRKIF